MPPRNDDWEDEDFEFDDDPTTEVEDLDDTDYEDEEFDNLELDEKDS